MRKLAAKIFILAISSILLATPALPRSSSRSVSTARSTRSSGRSTSIARTARRSNSKCASCARDSRGRIRRSTVARRAFRQAHPCPSTGRISGACPGYVIDHVKALKHGGADEPGNMQWQTTAAAKAKDRVE